MTKVALVGGIGSGKSTVSALFAECGAAVIDLDEIGHEVLACDDVKLAVARRFGADVIGGDGCIARPVLAARAFASSANTEALNAITHPRIMAIFAQRADELLRTHDVVVAEVTAGEISHEALPWAQAIVAVAAPVELRLERACERGQQREDVLCRMDAQPTDEQRCAVADYVIENTAGLDELRERVAEVYAEVSCASKRPGCSACSPADARPDCSACSPASASPDGPERGYVQVYTGDGKGKTTAAAGLALRALDAGMRVYFGQFMKCGRSGEVEMLRRVGGDLLTVAQWGCGTELSGESDAAHTYARSGFDEAYEALTSGNFQMVIFDEANVAEYCGYFGERKVVELIAAKPQGVELVITGRYAADATVAAADLVTEMREVKHYFNDGVQARRGIEF